MLREHVLALSIPTCSPHVPIHVEDIEVLWIIVRLDLSTFVGIVRDLVGVVGHVLAD